jgi:periplasmic divalent cation tolerance protein
MSKKVIIVLTTVSSISEAQTIARRLVTEKLAACVQVLPKMRSFYFWEGKVQEDEEFLLLIKTGNEKYVEIESFLHTNHSYTTPEIIALEAENVSESYQNWLVDYLAQVK